MALMTEGSKFKSRLGPEFDFYISSGLALGLFQPPVQQVLGTLSPGVKWQELKAVHSPPASAKVKKTWIYTFTPPYVFLACCLVKHRDNFAFTQHATETSDR
jgi:hypothetical protein